MDDDSVELVQPIDKQSFWQEHRYLILVAVSIGLALVLVSISMYLYTSSGASQLDLSRPGYKKVTEQIETDESSYQSFSSIGGVDSSTIDEFTKLFDDKSARATEVDAFSGDPLDPDVLQISAPSN